MLSYQRPDSLQRLLNSLEQSEYNFVEGNPNWQLLLEIRVDGGWGGSDLVFAKKNSKKLLFLL